MANGHPLLGRLSPGQARFLDRSQERWRGAVLVEVIKNCSVRGEGGGYKKLWESDGGGEVRLGEGVEWEREGEASA